MSSQPPYDEQAELDVIAATLFKPDMILDIGALLEPEDFYTPRCQALWRAFRELWEDQGIRPDAYNLTKVANDYLGSQTIQSHELTELIVNSITAGEAQVTSIKRTKKAREILIQCREAMQAITDGSNPDDVSEDLDHFVSTLDSSNEKPHLYTYWEFEDRPQPNSEPIIPDIIHQDWKGLLVAPEGVGKAVLLRSMCMTTAQGVHVFTHRSIEPRRTLLVDLENPQNAITETGHILEGHLMRTIPEYDETRFKIWHHPEGMNIRRRRDRSDLQNAIAQHQPDLVCIGPLYKLYSRKSGESYEDSAEEVLEILDHLRVKYGFALMIEHHAKKGEKGNRGRVIEPMGSQRWMGWPELGIGLRPVENSTDLQVEHFRPSRMAEDWPDVIVRNQQFLVSGLWNSGPPRFERKS